LNFTMSTVGALTQALGTTLEQIKRLNREKQETDAATRSLFRLIVGVIEHFKKNPIEGAPRQYEVLFDAQAMSLGPLALLKKIETSFGAISTNHRELTERFRTFETDLQNAGPLLEEFRHLQAGIELPRPSTASDPGESAPMRATTPEIRPKADAARRDPMVIAPPTPPAEQKAGTAAKKAAEEAKTKGPASPSIKTKR
jgi:hypothetical protein